MPNERTSRIILGAVAWLVAIAAFSLSGPAQALPRQAERLYDYAARGPLRVDLACPAGTRALHRYDAVYERRADGRLYQVGEVIAFRAATEGEPALAAVDIYSTDRDRLGATSRFEIAFASGSPRWILEALLPEPKRRQLIEHMEAFVEENEDLILETAALMGDELLREGRGHLEGNLSDVLKRHEKELAAALEKHGGAWNDNVVPALKKNVWPYARERSQPILQDCVEDIWNELPLTSTVWGALKSRVKESVGFQEMKPEWREELVKLIVRTLESHGEDFQKALVETAQFAASDAEVRAALGETAAQALSDPEVVLVLKNIFRDAIVKEFDTRAFVKSLLEDARIKGRLDELYRRLEPRLLEVAQLLTVSDDGRTIDPDLARVLRRAIFNKDHRVIMVAFGPTPPEKPDEPTGPVAAGYRFRAELAGEGEEKTPPPKRGSW